MKHLFFIGLMLLFLLNNQRTFAQRYPEVHKIHFNSDSVTVLHKRPWRAASEVVGLNIGVWAFDRYALKGDYAYINWSTIKRNFKTGPLWDNDKFSSNLFAHPFHGSLYFNSARSNGLNFWQSMPYAIGGSLMWEFFMECEYPSTNDLLATSFGGMAIGEVTYRITDLLIDNRTTGINRVGREALAAIIAPTRFFNRLIAGDVWRHSRVSGKTIDPPPINFVASVGGRFLSQEDAYNDGGYGVTMSFRLDYGDAFFEDEKDPYEWFQFRTILNFASNQPIIGTVNAVGVLRGWNVYAKNNHYINLGLFQHFDYYDSQITSKTAKIAPYKLAEAVAFGGGMIYQSPINRYGWQFSTEVFANAVLLGASIADYYHVDERDYNLGSGFSDKLYLTANYQQRFSATFMFENYQLYTWKGYPRDIDWETVNVKKLNAQGDLGNTRLSIIGMRFVYFFNDKLNLGLLYRNFRRKSDYKYHEDVNYNTFDTNLSLGYSF